MKRKIIQLAGKTSVVSIPAKWIRKYDIKKGDEVDITEQGNSIVITTNQELLRSEKAKVDITNLDKLTGRVLAALYKSGYDEIEVTFSNTKELENAQNFVRESFIGFEITEQRKNSIVIKKISEIEIEEFDTILRRVFLVLLSVADESYQASAKQDKEWLKQLVLRDKDINKLTDFCRRIINKKGYAKFKRNPPLYFIVEQIEKIGDLYRELCKTAANNKKKPGKELLALHKTSNDFLRKFYHFYYNFDLKSLNEFAREFENIKKSFKNISHRISRREDFEYLSWLDQIVEAVFGMNGALMAVVL